MARKRNNPGIMYKVSRFDEELIMQILANNPDLASEMIGMLLQSTEEYKQGETEPYVFDKGQENTL